MTSPDHQAFPLENEVDLDGDPGLTKREYFAALALQGFLATKAFSLNKDGALLAAEYAVRQADLLIAALNTPALP